MSELKGRGAAWTVFFPQTHCFLPQTHPWGEATREGGALRRPVSERETEHDFFG